MFLTDLTSYIWLGASDVEDNNSWKWVDEEILGNYDSRWGEDDPDAGDDDLCLGVGTRKIYDRNCHDENSFICEIPI